MDQEDKDIISGIIALAIFILFFVLPWLNGAGDFSQYDDLSALEKVGMAIGDWLRGSNKLWSDLKEAISNWLGF